MRGFRSLVRSVLIIGVGVVLVLLARSRAAAQTGIYGDIEGRIVDASGGALPGVTITLTGPALMGTRTTVSVEDGRYRFPALPQGEGYTLQFELEGFKTLIRKDIAVNIRKTTSVTAQLELAGIKETVVVTGGSPLVDTQNARQGMSLTSQILQSVPTGRDPYTVLEMTPGTVKMTPNVGGASTDLFQNAVVNGTTARRMNVNGAETAVRFSDGRYIAFDAYEEMVVETGGATADTRRPGGGYSLEMIPRSGGNEFHGTLQGFWFNDSLVGSNIDDTLRRAGLTSSSDTKSLHDVSASAGGPILKDRLWWFSSVRDFRTFRRTIGSNRLQEGRLIPFVVNITSQLDSANRLQFFYSRTYKHNPQRDMSRFTTYEASFNQKSWDPLIQAKWLRTMGANTFLELQGFRYKMWWPSLPQEGSGAPMRDLVTGLKYNGQANDHTQRDFNRYQVSASVSQFVDSWGHTSHNFKFGFDYFGMRYRELISVGNGPDSQVRYEFRRGAPAFAAIYNGPVNVLRNEDSLSGYAQDRIAVGRLTINAGARWDWYNAWRPAQASPTGNRWEAIFPALQFPEAHRVLRWSTVSPRLNAVFRLTEDGRNVVKGSYGRYPTEMDPSNDTDFVNPNSLRFERHVWLGDLNGNNLLDLNELGPLVSKFVPRNNRLDPNLKNPFAEEVGLSYERELPAAMAFKAQYFYARYHDTVIPINTAIPPTAYLPVSMLDPGPDGIAGTGDDRQITVYSVERPFVGGAAFLRTNFPGVQRRAHSLSFTVQKKLSTRWQLLASYAFNRVRETQAVDATDPNARINATGRADVDAPHDFKLVGSSLLPYDLQVSAQWQIHSGFPYDRQLQVFGLNQGQITILADPRGSYRHDTMSVLDTRIEKQVRLGGSRLGLMFEGFNMLNSNASLDIGTTDLGRGTITGGNFGQIIHPVSARTFRLGARFTF